MARDGVETPKGPLYMLEPARAGLWETPSSQGGAKEREAGVEAKKLWELLAVKQKRGHCQPTERRRTAK